MYVYTYIGICYICICLSIYLHTCVCVYMYIYIHMYVHIYIDKCMCVYTYMYKESIRFLKSTLKWYWCVVGAEHLRQSCVSGIRVSARALPEVQSMALEWIFTAMPEGRDPRVQRRGAGTSSADKRLRSRVRYSMLSSPKACSSHSGLSFSTDCLQARD